MCGSGHACEEIYADREGHLYFIVDEESKFHRECQARLGSRQAGAA